MAMFVHLTPETNSARIRRTGIRAGRRAAHEAGWGVFALPVSANFAASHQWLRELKRFHRGVFVGVYFRIADHEPVRLGRYRQGHRRVTAAEASALFTAEAGPDGWEVIIPRRIAPSELHRIRPLPQLVGWRFSPESKGKPPFCVCTYCTRGEYGSRRLRARLSR